MYRLWNNNNSHLFSWAFLSIYLLLLSHIFQGISALLAYLSQGSRPKGRPLFRRTEKTPDNPKSKTVSTCCSQKKKIKKLDATRLQQQTTTMISFRHLSRSPALHSSMQRHCLRRPSAVYSSPVAAPFSSFFANNGFSSTVPNAAPAHAPTENGHVLTKTDLAQIISAEHDLKLAQSNRILNTLLDTIVEVRVRFYLAYFFHVSCHNNIICYLTKRTYYYVVPFKGRLQTGHCINLRLWEI